MSDLRAAPVVDPVETVRRWLSAASAGPDREAPADRLSALLRDPDGTAFTTGLVDRVLRADDARTAGRELERLSRRTPGPLPWWVKGAAVLGGGFAPLLPRAVGPAAHVAVRRTVGHLVLESTPEKLGAALAELSSRGVRLDLRLLGEAVLGHAGALRRLRGVHDLLTRDDVERVSVAVSDAVPPASPWAFDETSDLLVERLAPLYETAAAARPPKSVDLDAGSWRELDLTVDVVTRLLDRDDLLGLEAGITLQAALPDAFATLQLLTDWSRQRVARGGAPVRVRLEKAAPLPEESVEAVLRDWEPAVHDDRREDDAALLRMLDWVLRPEHADVVRVGLATHDLFAVAEAWGLARARGVEHQLDVELDLGVAPALLDAVVADVGRVLLHVPVVRPSDFPAAADHLSRRVRDAARGGPLAAGGTAVVRDDDVLAREAERHRAAVARAAELRDAPVPGPRRRQDRSRPGEALDLSAAAAASSTFLPAADTDPALDRNRGWGRRVLAAARPSDEGVAGAAGLRLDAPDLLDELLSDAARAAVPWGREDPATRAELLDMVADEIATQRARLVEVAVSETGATLAEADRDVSDAVDAARWHARLGRGLADVEGARHDPARLSVLLTPEGSPFATAVTDLSAALVAGGAVVWAPAPSAVRCAAVLDEVLHRAGVPRSLLAVVVPGSGDLLRRLVGHPAVEAVLLTGSLEAARELRAWRHELPLRARTGGSSSIVVTPSADLDRAVVDVVASAYAHAGQHRSAIDHVVLVGTVATSERFLSQLADAVRSLRAGWAHEAATQVGPLRQPASGALLRALTTLDEGESWLVEPQRLDDEGRLWSPGVKTGVDPGRVGHGVAGPLLGVVAVDTLDEAIALQSRRGSRPAAGLQSLDPDEIATWAWGVDAGQLTVDRPTTGTMTRRRPEVGRGRSSVGPVVAAGGPSAVVAQGTWTALPHPPHPSLRLTGVPDVVVPVIEASRSSLSFEQFDHVRAGARSDQLAWEGDLAPVLDVGGSAVERDVLRHRPRPVVLRLAEGADLAHLVRLVAAATRVRSRLVISSAVPLPAALVLLFRSPAAPVRVDDVVVESDDVFVARLAAGRLQGGPVAADDALDLLRRVGGADAEHEARAEHEAPPASAEAVAAYRDLTIRLIGGDARRLHRAVHGSVDVTVWSGDVTEEGRVELLPFLAEQSVSVAVHRHGVVDPALAAVRL